MDSDIQMVRGRLLRLVLALLVGCSLGLFSPVVDQLSHALGVAFSGCPKTLESYINCGGRGPHMEIGLVLGTVWVVALTLVVGWNALILIREGS
jgi:hypothetical protein